MISKLRLRLGHAYHSAQRAVATPSGFRLAIAASALLVALSSLSFCLLHGVPSVTQRTWNVALRHIEAYWQEHWLVAAVVIASYLLVCSDNVARTILDTVVAPIEIKLSDFERDQRLHTTRFVVSVIAIVVALLALPFLSILAPNWMAQSTLSAITIISGMLSVALTLPTSVGRRVEPVLSRLTLSNSRSFDVASIGSACEEAAEAKVEFARRRRNGLVTHQAFDTNAFMQKLAHFVGVDKETLTLHEKTTAALRAALGYCWSQTAACVYADLEYDSVRAVVAGMFAAQARLVVCSDELWRGVITGKDVARRLGDSAASALEEGFETVVICVSHVAFETGVCVDVEALVARFKADRRVMIVVDGAQAIGNIAPERSLVSSVHFYAFSGHKWLLGEPTLGVLYANTALLAVDRDKLVRLLVQERPFSYWGQIDHGDKETVNLDAYVTLNATLTDLIDIGARRIEQHNTLLAGTCRMWLERLSIVDVPRVDQRGGIVAIRTPRADELAEQLRKHGFITRSIRNNEGLRLSIHYTIGERGAHELCYELGRLIACSRRT